MGKTTIYLNKEAQAVFDKAKEYAGDNLSSIIAQGLKFYVDKMDAQSKGMVDLIIFEGSRYIGGDDMKRGKNIKFVGRELATANVEDDGNEDTLTLYLTRKGKFLLHKASLNKLGTDATYSYKIYETYADLLADGLPGRMLDEARDKMPEVACEEMDL